MAAFGFSRGVDCVSEAAKAILSGAAGCISSLVSGILGDGSFNDGSHTHNTAPQYETFPNI